MKSIKTPKEFFNIEDTLSCGQVFRYKKTDCGFFAFSADKCALLTYDNENTVITCNDGDEEYFKNYFDLSRDYKAIYDRAVNSEEEIVKKSAGYGKGVRILRQDKTETLFSFIVSQNNNIPRIKGIIERLCENLGEKKEFAGEIFYTFPTAEKMSEMPESFFSSIGLGYRAPYIKRLADDIKGGFSVESLTDGDLKKNLLSVYGVGPKVADCVMLFGFSKTDAFPVDTWIEKVYREDFKGKETDRKKISLYFTNRFKEDSGFIQQYLFYYKRTLGTE